MRYFHMVAFNVLSTLIIFVNTEYEVDCNNLLMGQYCCNLPTIDKNTQQPIGCTKENKAKVKCSVSEGLVCKGTSENTTFEKEIPCKYTNGYSFELALMFSVFLGMFGVDRFYLGYPAIGLLKLSTLGFMFLGQLVDIILIALQIVGPADGSGYVISYYGSTLDMLKLDNETVKMSSSMWS
uniref:TM2 domain-containing protein n=1 Tax=Strigamia maritima TaxID=126957 RepID=T1INI2_STRMM